MIVLDTHALIWWVSRSDRLSASAARAIDNESEARGEVLVSAISAWEIAMLIGKGRLTLSMELDEWLDAVLSVDCIVMVPVNARVAVRSTRLPGHFHDDPADRMIVALAREYSAALVTADARIQAYRGVKCIW